METTVTLEYGPLTAEIHAREDENYQNEILDLLQFLEDNEEEFEKIGGSDDSSEMTLNKTGSASLESFGENDEDDDSEITDETESNILGSIASELRVSVMELEEFLYVDSEGEDFPVIYMDELGEIGERQTDRQRIGSLVLLYLWHECYEEDRVKSSSLKDALELSNISSSGMANMYQGEGDRYFDRRGRGPTATVKLTPPGKRQARKVLRRLVNQEKDAD